VWLGAYIQESNNSNAAIAVEESRSYDTGSNAANAAEESNVHHIAVGIHQTMDTIQITLRMDMSASEKVVS
jgi:hypothetical protein